MPYILDGRPISPDRAFTHNGIQYPANWIRLASEAEKAAIGLSYQPDPPVVDQRFYWDTGVPKDHAELVAQWVDETKRTANTLLAPTDWYITRQAESAAPAPQDVLDRRAEIRVFSNDKEQAILATVSTEELAAYITSAEYSRWEPEPPV